MNTDYSDLRFTTDDGTTLLSYYLETYTATRAIVWLKIPKIEAKEKLNYFLYYCNPDAISASDPKNTFIFFDDFDALEDWTTYGSGTLSQDNTTFPGVTTLKKDFGCDPSGGYKALGQTINSFRLITREYRFNDGTDCGLDRYGLEGNGFNGYGIKRSATATNNGSFGFERRTNGGGGGAQQSTLSQPRENWYRIELTRCYEDLEDLEDDITTALLYDDDKTIIGDHSGSDDNYTEFDKVVVRGGRPYFFDFIAVGNFVCKEPDVKFKNVESDEPEISCQDITLELDEDGFILFDPELGIASSTDCNTLSFEASETSFDCGDLGTNNVKIIATDAHENESICQSKVTIVDNLAPEVQCPNNISVIANTSSCSAIVTWDEPNTNDNCSSTVKLDSDFNSGDLFTLGTTTVTYTAEDAAGNISECSFSITVTTNATTPLLALEESSGLFENDGIICEGDKFCLTASENYSSYIWSDGSTDNPFCAASSGTYHVTVSNNIGCTAVSEAITIISNSPPSAGTCNLVNDYCMENTGSVSLQASNGTAPYVVNWTPAIDGVNSGLISNSGELIHINNIPGGTTLNFTVVDQNGCTSE